MPYLIRLFYGTKTPGAASVRITDLIICRPEIAAWLSPAHGGSRETMGYPALRDARYRGLF